MPGPSPKPIATRPRALTMVGGRDAAGSGPEGPFETENLVETRRTRALSSPEMARVLDFVEQMESEAETVLGLKTGYREMRIMITPDARPP